MERSDLGTVDPQSSGQEGASDKGGSDIVSIEGSINN
jgi:hypothetical protein